jgi:hypothetical protein
MTPAIDTNAFAGDEVCLHQEQNRPGDFRGAAPSV